MLRIYKVLLWGTYPFLLLSGLLWAGCVFAGGFIVTVAIHNSSAETLRVTPIGTVGNPGFKTTLPLVSGRFPYLPASQVSQLSIAPGDTLTLHYDFDDINFSEIVVHDERGGLSLLVVDPQPTVNQYHAPAQREFDIDPAELTSDIPASLVAVIRGTAPAQNSHWSLYAILIGPWILCSVLAILIARSRRLAAELPSPRQPPT
ncbi:MAG: hypothetical protein JSS02_19705 [Planctomycetes bacterium]|nr:hypothetical protein [Planctomycetota bacterium]